MRYAMENKYIEPDDEYISCIQCNGYKIMQLCNYQESPYHKSGYFCSDYCCEAWEAAHEDEVSEYIEQEGE
jgi:hypothetical protein